MVHSIVRLAAAGAFSAVALLASNTLAQPAPPTPNQGMDRGHRDEGAWREKRQARRAEQAQALRAALQLRPDQEGAFQTFEQATAPQHPMGERREAGAEMATLTTPQRLDMHLSHMDAHEAKVRQVVAATKSFYAVLSPQQQQAFDGLMALREHHHGFGGRMGGGPAG